MDKYFFIAWIILLFINFIFYLKIKRKRYYIETAISFVGFMILYIVNKYYFSFFQTKALIIGMVVSQIVNLIVNFNKGEEQKD